MYDQDQTLRSLVDLAAGLSDRDITSVADWDQIEPAVIIEAARSGRRDVFAELFESTRRDALTLVKWRIGLSGRYGWMRL